METRKAEVLLALQQALLGEVPANLRVVTVVYDESSIHFDAYFDGEITDDAREAMSRVETEVMALFPETHTVSHTTIRCDYPQPIPKDRTWVYCRQEGES